MSQFTIDKGVPLPPHRPSGGMGRLPTYPWHQMEVGDSFFVPGGVLKKLATAASATARRHPPLRFSLRTVDGGVRVWRIA